MITITPTSHTNDDGIETYAYPSALTDSEQHCVTRTDAGPWKIAPADPVRKSDLTIEGAKRYVDEVRFLIQVAERLEREAAAGAKAVDPTDAAITAEVQAILGDRDWTVDDAAVACGMTRAKLAHRIGGHSSWTLSDLGSLADGLSRDREERTEILQRLTSLGLEALSGRTLAVSL